MQLAHEQASRRKTGWTFRNPFPGSIHWAFGTHVSPPVEFFRARGTISDLLESPEVSDVDAVGVVKGGILLPLLVVDAALRWHIVSRGFMWLYPNNLNESLEFLEIHCVGEGSILRMGKEFIMLG